MLASSMKVGLLYIERSDWERVRDEEKCLAVSKIYRILYHVVARYQFLYTESPGVVFSSVNGPMNHKR